MYSMIPILVALVLATLSILVQFKKDKNRRKRIEQALEIPAGVAFIVTLFFTVANFRELNKIALSIALIVLLVPFFLYPFSAVLKDAHKQYSHPLYRTSQKSEVTYGTVHSQFRQSKHL